MLSLPCWTLTLGGPTLSPERPRTPHTQLKTDTYDLLANGSPTQIADAVEADTSLSRSTLETVAEAMEIEAGYEEVLEVALNGSV